MKKLTLLTLLLCASLLVNAQIVINFDPPTTLSNGSTTSPSGAIYVCLVTQAINRPDSVCSAASNLTGEAL